MIGTSRNPDNTASSGGAGPGLAPPGAPVPKSYTWVTTQRDAETPPRLPIFRRPGLGWYQPHDARAP